MSKKSLDALGVAITNAGYTWTPEMRSAYEKGIRESEWVGLEDEDVATVKNEFNRGALWAEKILKEKNSV